MPLWQLAAGSYCVEEIFFSSLAACLARLMVLLVHAQFGVALVQGLVQFESFGASTLIILSALSGLGFT